MNTNTLQHADLWLHDTTDTNNTSRDYAKMSNKYVTECRDISEPKKCKKPPQYRSHQVLYHEQMKEKQRKNFVTETGLQDCLAGTHLSSWAFQCCLLYSMQVSRCHKMLSSCEFFSPCDHKLRPMTLINKYDLHRVNGTTGQNLGQVMLFSSYYRDIHTDDQIHAQKETIKWLVKVSERTCGTYLEFL